MDGCSHGWMGVWMVARVDVFMDEYVSGWMRAWMVALVDGCVSGWLR